MNDYVKIIEEKYKYAQIIEPRFRENDYCWIISEDIIHNISKTCVLYNPRDMCLELAGIKIIPTKSLDVIELYREVKRYV